MSDPFRPSLDSVLWAGRHVDDELPVHPDAPSSAWTPRPSRSRCPQPRSLSTSPPSRPQATAAGGEPAVPRINPLVTSNAGDSVAALLVTQSPVNNCSKPACADLTLTTRGPAPYALASACLSCFTLEDDAMSKLTLEAKARLAATWADQAGELELVKDSDLAHYLVKILLETPAGQDLLGERIEQDYRAGREQLLRREGMLDADRSGEHGVAGADDATVVQAE